MARDYAAERARRWELEQLRANAEGRAPSKAKARGHVSPEYEAQKRKSYSEANKLNYWTKKTAYGIELPLYRQIVKDGVDRSDRPHMIERLKRKAKNTAEFMARVAAGQSYADAAVGSQGRADYLQFQQREAYMPVQLFWYHGGR